MGCVGWTLNLKTNYSLKTKCQHHDNWSNRQSRSTPLDSVRDQREARAVVPQINTLFFKTNQLCEGLNILILKYKLILRGRHCFWHVLLNVALIYTFVLNTSIDRYAEILGFILLNCILFRFILLWLGKIRPWLRRTREQRRPRGRLQERGTSSLLPHPPGTSFYFSKI